MSVRTQVGFKGQLFQKDFLVSKKRLVQNFFKNVAGFLVDSKTPKSPFDID